MLAVNLLPWRTQQWQRRRQQSFSLLGGTLATTGLIIMVLWWRGDEQYLQQQVMLTDASQRRDVLQQQLALQHSLLQQRDGLLQVQRALQQKRQEHRRWQQFWQQLPTLMPDALWLNRVERRQRMLLFEGQAQSMLAVRDFRQRLVTQSLFANVKPGSVQRQASGEYRFVLQARVQEMADE
ncbi:fimbrial assembly protein [Pantoea rwandensis]|uniref:Fimbrial assembly protein n=2 Tax=Pantoea rwandensis TaxID=1076550 RepID=A0A1X1CTR9_9GAMM|nr:fimbrial assembly protein [Pantoea rwandensis]